MTTSVAKQPSQERQLVAHRDPVDTRAAPDDIVVWIENHLESWRQIPHYVGLARGKTFDTADEDQFLELKGVIVQELEMILASGECHWPTKDDVHEMMNNVPSLRHISQLSDGALGNVEHQWHLIYIRWHATLGRLKVKYRELEARNPKSGFLHRWTSWRFAW
jgi:hypothetical protein